jgi:methylenetetrahydrofolate dehydrogenase (NADP+)/methenyltetrahydrofolate cyclohydrolase
MAQIIDGKAIAAEFQESLAAEAAALKAQGIQPALAVVLVGDDPGSQYYVRSKVKAAERLGIVAQDFILPTETTQEELNGLVDRLNADPAVHGILVQMPLPEHLDPTPIINGIAPHKDVDGFHPFNVGELVIRGTAMPPCTPAGVLELLKRTAGDLKGMEAVVVGRSMLVGKPVAMLLLAEHATVTLCHSRTRDLPAVCRRADLLIVAIGRPRMITGDYVKPGAVVIDVGINRVEGKIVGDVDFDSAAEKAGAISPVPGGVGPMTITMLMKNTLTAARRTQGVSGPE